MLKKNNKSFGFKCITQKIPSSLSRTLIDVQQSVPNP